MKGTSSQAPRLIMIRFRTTMRYFLSVCSYPKTPNDFVENKKESKARKGLFLVFQLCYLNLI